MARPAGGTGAVGDADRVAAGRPAWVRRCQLAGAASSATNLAAAALKPPTTRR
jgi:hypothetical protein